MYLGCLFLLLLMQFYSRAQEYYEYQEYPAMHGGRRSRGVRGVRASRGVRGARAAQEYQEYPDMQGARGSRGVRRVRGSRGIRRVRGSRGARGAQEYEEYHERQGAQEYQEMKGDQGLQEYEEMQGAQGPQENKKHKLNYWYGDHRPHFGYHPSHWASDHLFRPHKRPPYPTRHKPWRPFVPDKEDIALAKSRATKPKPKANVGMRSGKRPKTRTESDKAIDFVVRIMAGDKFLCSGMLVAPETVLTSTTCFLGYQPDTLTIQTGDGATYSSTNTSPADGFATGDATALLSVIKLSKKAGRQYNKSPELCDTEVRGGSDVLLASWDNEKGGLNHTEAITIPRNKCREMLKDPDGKLVTNSTICVSNNRQTSGCENSFGMPLFMNGKLCGLNIMGHNCPEPFGADVYVSVLGAESFFKKEINFMKKSKIHELLA